MSPRSLEPGGSTAPSPNVSYVLTHHPAAALTFIALEIREIERSGGRVTPVSVNSPGDHELTTDAARAARRETLYLKQQGPLSLGWALLSTWFGHPVATTRLAGLAIASSRFDLPVALRRLIHLAYACWTWRATRGRQISHFHAHFGQTPATIAWFTAAVGSFASGQRCTWSFTIHGFQDFADERLGRLDLKAESASFVVCVSDFTRAQLCRVSDPSTWARFHVVRCGIDLDAFAFRPRTSTGRLRVLTVARLSPEKGHLILLDALRGLLDDGTEIELRIIGDGPSEAAIVEFVERHHLHDRVTLLGAMPSDQIGSELAAADVFCLPSFAEGIPVSIMEAMAVGTAVVTTYVGGIPELAVHERTALVVPAASPGELARALRRMAEEPELRARLALAARQAVAEHHDVVRNVGRLRQLFDDVRL